MHYDGDGEYNDRRKVPSVGYVSNNLDHHGRT